MKHAVMMKPVSYIKLQRRYGGKFVARHNGRVLASETTYRKLLQLVRKRHLNRQKLIVGYIPPQGTVCIYPIGVFCSSQQGCAISQVPANTHLLL